MKNPLRSVLITLCASLLFTSCSKLGSLTITKRHYRSGFYVDLPGKKQDVAVQERRSFSRTENAAVANPAEEKKELTPVAASKPVKPAMNAQHAESQKKVHKKATQNTYASAQDQPIVASEIRDAQFENYTTALPDIDAATSSNDESVPYWLMIVFCIILPPLAVGLKFGIVDKFWISILLTLLFWLPGVIYALILITGTK